MPSGMSLNSTTCAISGTPSLNSTTTSYTITASNSVGNTIAVINITVVSPAPLGKRIFVTSSGYSPGSHFTTTITADMKCGIDPGKPIGAGTYKAMIVSSARTACISANCTTSGAAEHLDWIFTPNTTYYQADGLTVVATTDANALMPATFINIATPHAKYWTGLITDWTTSSMNCANWGNTGMSTCGGSSPNNASANFTDIWGSVTCSAPQQLLCVEQ
jgi:hypothetical protein